MYGLRRIAAIQGENLREGFEVEWETNVFIILSFLDFDYHSSRFILNRIKSLI